MTRFGKVGEVDGNRLVLPGSRGEPVEVSLDHVNSISTVRSRHEILGAIFLGYGVLALAGAIKVIASDSVIKDTQIVTAIAGVAIGLFLFMGRQVIRIETSSGTTRTTSVFWWDAERAIALVDAVRVRIFDGASAPV